MKFTKEFVLGLFKLKKTSPEKVDGFLNSLSDKQHVELIDTIQSLADDLPPELHDDELKRNLASINNSKAQLEENIVDADVKKMMQDIELEALAQERRVAFMALKMETRKKLIETPESPEAKRIAELIIRREKEHQLYIEEEWAEVLHLLEPGRVPAPERPMPEPTEPESPPTDSSPYSRPPLTRNQIFLKLDKIKFKPEEVAHFMSTKGITREEFCIAVPILFSMYEESSQYKNNKAFRDEIIKQKKIQYQIVADYTEAFKKQKEREDELKASRNEAVKAIGEVRDQIKDRLMLEPKNEEVKHAIREIIKHERTLKIYDEEYWQDVLHLL